MRNIMVCIFCVVWNMAFSQDEILLRNARIVDVKKGKLSKPKDVLIIGERIARIAKSGKLKIEGGTILDVEEQYIMPGLWDMHAGHLHENSFAELYALNGVIGIRSMNVNHNYFLALQDSMSRLLLPCLEMVSGACVQGEFKGLDDAVFVADIPDRVTEILDVIEAQGFDFVSIGDGLSKSVYLELARQSKERGKVLAGEIPVDVSVNEAVGMGQRSIEQLFGLYDMCLQEPVIDKNKSVYWLDLVLYNEQLANADIDYNLGMKAFKKLANEEVWICPTLTYWRKVMYPYEMYGMEETHSYFNKKTQNAWANDILRFHSTGEQPETMAATYEFLRQVTSLLGFADVKMMLGTGAEGPYVYPGYSVHEEIMYLQECEFSDREILKMAAWNPVEFLEMEDNYGSIEEGKYASFLILPENPLYDVSVLKSIDGILLKGYYFEKSVMSTWKNGLN